MDGASGRNGDDREDPEAEPCASGKTRADTGQTQGSSTQQKPHKDIRRISELGIKIAIDDFGTGYSSLAKLAEIPIDTLKIDKSFVDNVITNEASTITTNSIIGLAKSLKKCVVAEGVENEDQLEYLAANGCDIIQGFIFGKPLPADDFYDAYMKKR